MDNEKTIRRLRREKEVLAIALRNLIDAAQGIEDNWERNLSLAAQALNHAKHAARGTLRLVRSRR